MRLAGSRAKTLVGPSRRQDEAASPWTIVGNDGFDAPKRLFRHRRSKVMRPDISGPGTPVSGSNERFFTGYVPVGRHIIRVTRAIAFGFLRRGSKSIQT